MSDKAVFAKRSSQNRGQISNLFAFGESYTSLFFGMLFVFLSALVFFLMTFHRNIQDTTSAKTQNFAAVRTVAAATNTDTKQTPGIQKHMNLAQNTKNIQALSDTYVVVAGDSVWSIAQKYYHDGYSWKKIADANNLTNPSTIHAANRLVIPRITPAVAMKVAQTVTVAPAAPKIQLSFPKTYTVAKGDSLWTISVKVYGNGYKWTQIARENHLNNPGMIFSGNVLRLPPAT